MGIKYLRSSQVKKMGITTGRQVQKKSMPQYPASFQSLQDMMNLEQYKGMADRMKDLEESNDSNSHPGSNSRDHSRDRDRDGGGGLDGRATLVPPAPGGIPTLNMLQMMERLRESSGKDNNGGGPIPPSEISLMPMNLSTMLSKGVHAAAAAHHASSRADLATLVPLHGGGGEGSADQRGERGGGGMSESSMSPTGGDGDRGEIEDEDEERGDPPPRERHRSADYRAQFFADLKRLGGNLPPPPPPPAPAPPAARESRETPEAAKASTSSPPPSISTTTATKGQ